MCFTLASCGPATFSHVRDTEGRRENFCVGEDSCSYQTTKDGSESILLVATLQSPFVSQTER